MIDRTLRYAPSHVLCDGRVLPVLRYVAHPAGTHPAGTPIGASLVALELVTAAGSRWFGFETAYINSDLRMVVAGFGSRDEVRSRWTKVSP